LCRSWQLGGEQLPDTKAQLFTQFVEVIYQWKDWTQETFTTPSRANKQELDQALGRLAQRAIDEEKSRFVLRQDFVTSELGDPEDPLSLFYLAKKLGWLNMVQEDLKNSQNNTWAFLHPTFQEYFAASALDDWDFFLPRNHKNSPVANKPYRIFEPQWKEVILLWLGRESIDEEQKKDFIRALVEFDDGCGKWPKKTLIDKGFYEYRAYFLAAAGIAEFGDFPRADEIVRQIVQWSFGYLDKKGERQRFPIEALAQEALQKTEPTKAIAILVQLIKSTRDEELLIQASESLGKIDCGNEIAIATLVQLVKSTEVHSLLSQAIKAIRSLGEIGRHNEMAIAALVQLAQSSRDEYILDEVIESLEKIDPGNETAIATALVSMISGASGSTLINAAESLGKIIRSGNEFAMAMLVKLLEPPSENEWRLRQAHEHALRSVVYALGKIGIGHEIAIAGLVRVIESEEYEYVRNYEFLRRRAVDSLGEIGTGNETAIVALVNLIKSTEDGDTRGRAIYILGEIGRGSETAITALVELLESPKDEGTRFQATESLRKIVTSNEIAITALVELLESAKDDNTGWLAVDLLETIGVGNEMAITALAKLLELELDVYTRRRVSYILKKISSGDEPSNSEGLVEVFESTENEETTIQASESLREIDSSNEFLIGSLVKKLESIEDEENIIKVAESLGKVDPGNETAISALVKVMRSDEYLSDQAIESLGEIGKGNEMAVAILVKVLKSTEDKETIIQAAKSLGKIDPGNETAISGLLKVIRSDEDEYLYDKAFACLEDIWLPKNFMEVVAALKDDLSLFLRFVPLLSSDRTLALYKALRLYRFDVVYSTKLYPVLDKGSQCYHAIWQCAQTLSYPEFYEAWHRSWLKSLPRLFR
jgi:HEAT repeat protein